MSTTMLYQHPGPHEIHGGRFDYVIVPDDEIEATMAAGWHLTTTAAKEASDAAAAEAAARAAGAGPDDNAPATRDELKAKADELKLTYPGNISTAKLAELIEAALKPQE